MGYASPDFSKFPLHGPVPGPVIFQQLKWCSEQELIRRTCYLLTKWPQFFSHPTNICYILQTHFGLNFSWNPRKIKSLPFPSTTFWATCPCMNRTWCCSLRESPAEMIMCWRSGRVCFVGFPYQWRATLCGISAYVFLWSRRKQLLSALLET